jgi:hypothetical protein
MKIGILCGTAQSAQRKALAYYDAIIAVGHEPTIFARAPLYRNTARTIVASTVAGLERAAAHGNLDFYIGCTDALGDSVANLNVARGYPVIPHHATHKDKLGRLSTKLDDIPTWAHIDEVPNGIPIMVKTVNGSGSIGGDPWAYARYDSIEAFKNYLTNELESGIQRFEYAQQHPGILGAYVFQQLIITDHYIYHHYLNDGTARHWMETKCDIPRSSSKTHFKISDVDAFDFAHNLPFGTFGSFQAFPAVPKPLIFDFNVRASAYWNVLHQYVCPDFFLTYFDNLLNKVNRKYEWKCDEFVMDPDTSNEQGFLLTIEDFPTTGTHRPYRIIMK